MRLQQTLKGDETTKCSMTNRYLALRSEVCALHLGSAQIVRIVQRILRDQLARIGSPALWAGRVLLLGATAMNISALKTNSDDWAKRSSDERMILELVAASPAVSTVNQAGAPLAFSPDVRIGDVAELVADGAIHPRVAATADEQAVLAAALSQPPP